MSEAGDSDQSPPTTEYTTRAGRLTKPTAKVSTSQKKKKSSRNPGNPPQDSPGEPPSTTAKAIAEPRDDEQYKEHTGDVLSPLVEGNPLLQSTKHPVDHTEE